MSCQCKKTTCPLCSIPTSLEDPQVLNKGAWKLLWDTAKNDFATRREVLELLLEVDKLKEIDPVLGLYINQQELVPNNKGQVEIRFEDWIQGSRQVGDGTSNEVLEVYNDSTNAPSTRAVGEALRAVYKAIGDLNLFRVEFVKEVDGYGLPIVHKPSHSVLYIMCEQGPLGMHFSEWLYLPIGGGTWERVGDKLDLDAVNDSIKAVSDRVEAVNKRLTTHSTKLYDMIENQKQNLIDFISYIESDKFIEDITRRMPVVSLYSKGLMTPTNLQTLEGLRLQFCKAGGLCEIDTPKVDIDVDIVGMGNAIVNVQVNPAKDHTIELTIGDATSTIQSGHQIDFDSDRRVRVDVKVGEQVFTKHFNLKYVDSIVDVIEPLDVDKIMEDAEAGKESPLD